MFWFPELERILHIKRGKEWEVKAGEGGEEADKKGKGRRGTERQGRESHHHVAKWVLGRYAFGTKNFNMEAILGFLS